MQRRLKERLIGAAVLVMLAVIFIPMLLDNSTQKETEITETNIPPRPDNQFSSRIMPVANTSEPSRNTSAKAPESDTTEKLPEGGLPPQPKPGVVSESQASLSSKALSPLVQPGQDLLKSTVSQTPAGTGSLNAWVVQIGSFTSEENAKSLHNRARSLGFTSFMEPLKQEGDTAYRVRVGPELTRSDAVALATKLKDALQVEGIVMQYP